jgi:hypothetical protein
MKGIVGQVFETPSADAEGQPVIGLMIGSLGALALWGAIVWVISLLV